MPKTRRTPPYWLQDGTETCEVCLSLHVLEMQYRCVACDHGLCEQCTVFVRESREVFCAACYESESPEE